MWWHYIYFIFHTLLISLVCRVIKVSIDSSTVGHTLSGSVMLLHWFYVVNHFPVGAFAPLWTAVVVICSDNSVCLNHWTCAPPLAPPLCVAWLIDKVKALCCPARICLCSCSALVDLHAALFFQSLSDRAGTLSGSRCTQTCWAKISHSIIGGHQYVASTTCSLALVLPPPLITDTNIRKPKRQLWRVYCTGKADQPAQNRSVHKSFPFLLSWET